MEREYFDGKIILKGAMWEQAIYDVAAYDLSVRFDGLGGITEYYRSNDAVNYASQTYSTFCLNGKKVDSFVSKTVEMIGRRQNIFIDDSDNSGSTIKLSQFVVKEINGVFFKIDLTATTETDFLYSLNVGRRTDDSDTDITTNCVKSGAMQLSCSETGVWSPDNYSFTVNKHFKNSYVIFLFLSFGSDIKADVILNNVTEYCIDNQSEISDIKLPESVKNEKDKALYLSSLFCVLENFTVNGSFKAFCAGRNYRNVLRTYFRDSYWTCLSVFGVDDGLIRNQIITLANGIDENGNCSSAVTFDFSAFWGDHFDSPSFFVMLIYDYINHTSDVAILDTVVGERTIFEKCVLAVEHLRGYEDGSGLILKQGPYNKKDWADEVNRNGYVSYDEMLYCRANFCLSELCRIKRINSQRLYYEKYLSVKKAINCLLWNEEKGYYNNFIDGDFVEDNLSVDTVISVLFGIADKSRSARLLKNMQKILETRNNYAQKAGDFGVMCVYPFYQNVFSTYKKSSQDFNYHNGANWPYLSALYAYALYLNGMDYGYALTSWFDYNVKNGNYTPVEYFSPCRKDGSLLQAWSGLAAFVFNMIDKKDNFFAPHFFASVTK